MKQTKKQMELYSKILYKIYTRKTISRVDIAKETGITTATVSLITADMLLDNLIREVGEDISDNEKVGRKKILLSIKPEYSYYIGCEISEKFLSFVLTDNTGIVKDKVNLLIDENTKLTTEIFIENLSEFFKKIKIKQINAIGIAIPGHFLKKSKNKIITNNDYWKDFDLQKISDSFNIPVYFSNNVHCMTRAESLFYSDSKGNNKNFIFFHIGRGIHCTHMYQDELYNKNNMNIGELGHITLQKDGELCECGKRGCLQTFASETWLTKKARLMYRISKNTYLHKIAEKEEDIDIDTILNAYNLGDEMIVNLINKAVESISITIENLGLIINSNRVFVHGKLFSTQKTIDLLKTQFNSKPSLFKQIKNQELIIKPYSIYTGAIGAAACSIYHDLLKKD